MSHGHFFNNYFGGTGNSFNISQNMYTMHQHHAPPTATPPDQYNAYYSDNKATRQGQQTKAAKVYFEEGKLFSMTHLVTYSFFISQIVFHTNGHLHTLSHNVFHSFLYARNTLGLLPINFY